jgi:hypothetical protein
MAIYSSAVYDTIGWFSYILDTYFFDVTLESFGFTSVNYDRNENALDILNSFVMQYGQFYSNTGEYTLVSTLQVENDDYTYVISYKPEHDGIPASTTVTVSCYSELGAYYSITLSLNSTDLGNRVDMMYGTYNDEGYTIMNTAWGYIDANSYVPMTPVVCYEFNGLNEYEDALLLEYALFVNEALAYLNYAVLPSVGGNITLKDLGFLFYFG